MLKNNHGSAVRAARRAVSFWLALLFFPALLSAEPFLEFARAKSRESAEAVEPALAAFLNNPGPAALYNLRKAFRNNLAAACDAFYQAYPVRSARKHRHNLIEIDGRLGALRDLDVIAEQLAGPFEGISGAREYLMAAEEERKTLLAAFIREMPLVHSGKIRSAAEFLKSGPPPDGFYSNQGEFWEKPQLALERETPEVFREMADYLVRDIRRHGYSPESLEEFHLTRAKLRALLSLLDLSPQKNLASLAAACAVLKRITGTMGGAHDKLVLKAWLGGKLPEGGYPLAEAVDAELDRLNRLARGQAVLLDKSGLLEEFVARWPGLGEPFRSDASVLDALRRHADEIHGKAQDEGRALTEFSLENMPRGISLIEFVSAFRAWRPELESEGWVETKPGLVAVDHGRKSLFHADPRPVPAKITGKIEYLDEKGSGISTNPRLSINGVKYKQKNPDVVKILAFKAPNMDADILAAEIFRILGFFTPETFPAYIKDSGGEWRLVLLTRWLDDAYVGESWGPAMARHAQVNAQEYATMRVADVLIGNWDRHIGNWFVTQSGKVIPIDHDLAFVTPSLLTSPESDWYVNFTIGISTEPDFSPNIYLNAASPFGCPPKNGGIHRILRREKVPVLEAILEKDPEMLLRTAQKVVEKLSPAKLRKAVDDIPVVFSSPERRKELADILISRRNRLVDVCRAYLAEFRKSLAERAAFAATRKTPPENGASEQFEMEKKYWSCHGRTGNPVVDTYYRVEEGRSMRIRETREGNFLTVKGPPVMEGTVKKRREIEFPVDAVIKEAFREAGIGVVTRVVKTRAEEKRTGCKALFDRVENLGEFVEIEGLPSAIAAAEKELGLAPAAVEERSYQELMTDIK
ncbi:MAG: CYTH domain-containing protein [Elusimicrobia bacterium]|nr:CYTH domain-containing protein [Elusimicrobiota bacterium]